MFLSSSVTLNRLNRVKADYMKCAAASSSCGNLSCAALGVSVSSAGLLSTQRRGRFYRPILKSGPGHFKQRQTEVAQPPRVWEYQPTFMTPRPEPVSPTNNYFGKLRLWNPILSEGDIMKTKVDQWDYPYRQPPPSGLRDSKEYFPHFFDRYFPNVECRLVIDSVLNNETTQPVFHFPLHMSKLEIANYLRNVYGLENIINIETRNYRGRYYKNEVGAIRNLPDYKEATVTLDAPVVVDFKQLKGTEDTPDNKKIA